MDNTGTKIFAVASDQNSTVYMGTTSNRAAWAWSDISGTSIPAADTWSSIAANGDGTKLLASKSGTNAGLFVGTFSGSSWTWDTASTTGDFRSAAVNDAGDRMFAATVGSAIQVSLDSGVSWASTGSSSSTDFVSIATDGAGNQLVANNAVRLYKGTYGAGVYNWAQVTSIGTAKPLRSVASSRDGSALFVTRGKVGVTQGDIAVSKDAGSSWSVAWLSAVPGVAEGDWTEVAVAG